MLDDGIGKRAALDAVGMATAERKRASRRSLLLTTANTTDAVAMATELGTTQVL